MKLFSILFSLFVFGLASCERHEWDHGAENAEERKSTDTINLFLHEERKGAHGDEKKEGEHKEGEDKKPEGDQ